MANYKTYQGSRLDLEIYQGKATIDYEIEVFKNDGTAFDFSIYASTVFKIYYRQHGELIVSPTITESGNSLLLDLTIAQSAALQTRDYWYECYGIYSGSEEELISYGIAKVV
jgi:hypothetical protein